MTRKKIVAANARYETLVNDLLNALSHHDDTTLNKKPLDGGWSAIQTLYHLILAEESSMQYVIKKTGFESNFEQVGLQHQWRSFLLWLIMQLPIKINAPAVTSKDLPDFATWADAHHRWMDIRKKWRAYFDGTIPDLPFMPDELADKAVFKHPRAGKLGWIQMIAFFKIHLERHRKQALNAVK